MYNFICFHPLSGFSSYLYLIEILKERNRKFPSPVGVFFLFIKTEVGTVVQVLGFHPLSGFSSYLYFLQCQQNRANDMFPSPVGVFFLFMEIRMLHQSSILKSFHPLSGFSSYLLSMVDSSALMLWSFHPLSGFSSYL